MCENCEKPRESYFAGGRRSGKTHAQADAVVEELASHASLHSSAHHTRTRVCLMDDIEWEVTRFDDCVRLEGRVSANPDGARLVVLLGARVLDLIAGRLGLS